MGVTGEREGGRGAIEWRGGVCDDSGVERGSHRQEMRGRGDSVMMRGAVRWFKGTTKLAPLHYQGLLCPLATLSVLLLLPLLAERCVPFHLKCEPMTVSVGAICVATAAALGSQPFTRGMSASFRGIWLLPQFATYDLSTFDFVRVVFVFCLTYDRFFH